MFKTEFKRREWLAAGTAALVGGSMNRAAGAQGPSSQAAEVARAGPNSASQSAAFLLGLNTSTIRGQRLSILEELAIAQKAGYQGMEPWVEELERYAASGGSLEDLAKRFRDAGISIESAIGFFEWIVDDPERRRKGLEAARRSMELVRRAGGKRLAAPPVGATDRAMSDLLKVAGRVSRPARDRRPDRRGPPGRGLGILADPEPIGRGNPRRDGGQASQRLHLAGRLPLTSRGLRAGRSEAPVAERHPCVPFQRLPRRAAREKLTDADRVYPGDGSAPLKALLKDLSAGGFRVMLSLELFNRKYWTQDPLTVARTGLEKMRALIQDFPAR